MVLLKWKTNNSTLRDIRIKSYIFWLIKSIKFNFAAVHFPEQIQWKGGNAPGSPVEVLRSRSRVHHWVVDRDRERGGERNEYLWSSASATSTVFCCLFQLAPSPSSVACVCVVCGWAHTDEENSTPEGLVAVLTSAIHLRGHCHGIHCSARYY